VPAPVRRNRPVWPLPSVAYLGAQTRSLAQDLVARTAARFPVDDQPLPEILEALQTVEAQGNILPALRWAGKAVSATDRSDLFPARTAAGSRQRRCPLPSTPICAARMMPPAPRRC